jgi:hypothetical protein
LNPYVIDLTNTKHGTPGRDEALDENPGDREIVALLGLEGDWKCCAAHPAFPVTVARHANLELFF